MRISNTICFIDDSKGFWNNFWDNRDGLGMSSSDPDTASSTLRQYHQILWNRMLPNGEMMQLQPKNYLTWNGYNFGSDSIMTQHRYKKCKTVINEVIELMGVHKYREFAENALRDSYTVGGTIIFPKMKNSLNQLRGTNPYICDRFDLTLECIKRYYTDPENPNYQYNPLYFALKNNKDFFEKFLNFSGYIDFFFLHDFIDEIRSAHPVYSGRQQLDLPAV